MAHDPTLGTPDELAACYLGGAMTPGEIEQFERHVAGGCEACARELAAFGPVVTALSASIAVAPPASVRTRLLERAGAATQTPGADQIWKRWRPETAIENLVIRRAGDTPWEETGVAGVRVRRLFMDEKRDQFTALVQMDPGASYPRHVHNGPEECLVISGDLHVGDTVMHAGDYQRAGVGSHHVVQRTERGCTLLIISSLSDEVY
ncbi:MAG: cupin domain-containing protein [Phycisphaerae bacterium]